MKTTWFLALLLVLVGFALPSEKALAREPRGLALGGGAIASTANVSPVINGNYWFGRVGLDFGLRFGFGAPVGGAGNQFNFGLLGGAIFVLAGNETTNLDLGARFGVNINSAANAAGVNVTTTDLVFEVPLRVEHWFDDRFAINCNVGLALVAAIDREISFGVGGTGFVGGAGFLYYFDDPDRI